MAAPTLPAATEEEESPADSGERAGILREQQRNGGGQAEQPADWNEQRGRMRKLQAMAEDKKKTVPKMSKSIGSSKFLQASWKNIIPSLSFSFYYIYIHLFLKKIFGERLFAPLGSEWADKPGTTVEMRDKKGEKLKIIEILGVILVTAILAMAILSSLSIVALIIEVVKNPLRAGVAGLEGLYSWINSFGK